MFRGFIDGGAARTMLVGLLFLWKAESLHLKHRLSYNLLQNLVPKVTLDFRHHS